METNIKYLTKENMPNPKMTLYGFESFYNGTICFNTKEELDNYMEKMNTENDNICIIDYLGNVDGCSDVIRKTYENGKSSLYKLLHEDGYGIYNTESSKYGDEFIWEYEHGSMRDIYDAFRDRGIVFENDIYAKSQEKSKQMIKTIDENCKKYEIKKSNV